jgi:hypothetical protein
MKSLSLSKLKDPDLKNYLALDFTLWLKVMFLVVIMCAEWILDIVVVSWIFTLIVPVWLAIIFGIIIGGIFTFPFRECYTDWTFTHLYYWLAFRKDKIMMSLLEEV